MNNALDFFRIKTEWTAELPGGSLSKTKTEELVYAANYTDAETVAHAIAKELERDRFGSYNIEIVKTKIGEVLYNDYLCQEDNLISGLICNYFEGLGGADEGLYSVKVCFLEEDEKSGKEKQVTIVYYTPAASGVDAYNFVKAYIKHHGSSDNFLIREVKFDKAENILWAPEIHQQKVNQFAKRD